MEISNLPDTEVKMTVIKSSLKSGDQCMNKVRIFFLKEIDILKKAPHRNHEAKE